MHCTKNLNDGYLGSGKHLRRAINKYGKENFTIEILEFLPDKPSLKLREKEIVTEDLLNNPMCMNLQPGGGGGCNKENQLIWAKAGGKGFSERVKNDDKFRQQLSIKASERFVLMHQKGEHNYNTFKGKNHTKETIDQMKLSHKGKHEGEKNSQFGTCWIYNENCNKKINKNDLNEYREKGWIKGRI